MRFPTSQQNELTQKKEPEKAMKHVHLDLLKQGRTVWNSQRPRPPQETPEWRTKYQQYCQSMAASEAAEPYGYDNYRVLSFEDYLNRYWEGVDLVGAELQGMDLRGYDLSQCNLKEGQFQDADVRDTNCSSASLRRADLTGADLRGANLTHASLAWTNLTSADLRGANLTSALLTGTRLIGADLRGANLEHTSLGPSRKDVLKGVRWRSDSPPFLCGALLEHKVLDAHGIQIPLHEQQNLTGPFTGLETLFLDEWGEIVHFYRRRCAYCGAPYEIPDHFLPISQGGTTWKGNVVPACFSCWSIKGRYRPQETTQIPAEVMERIASDLERSIQADQQ